MSITAVVVDTDDLFAIDVEFGTAPEATVEVNSPSIEIGVPGLSAPADLSGYLPLTGGTLTGSLGIGVTPPYPFSMGDGAAYTYARDYWGEEYVYLSATPGDCGGSYLTRGRGSIATSGAAAQNGDVVYQIMFGALNGGDQSATAGIAAVVDNVVSPGVSPIALSFGTGAAGAVIERLRITSAGRAILSGPLTLSPLSSETPAVNGQLSFEATSNTQLKLKYKGSDGVVRSATLTLA